MLQNILDFLVHSDWVVNHNSGKGLMKIEAGQRIEYSVATDLERVNEDSLFTMDEITEIELDFAHKSAIIWTEDK